MKQTHEVRLAFTLMKLNDAISHFYMQMPRWLFSDPQYAGLSLERKVAYTFLLNRFQLSRRNGWVNRHGEVYVIYTREDLAREMQVSYRKAITCFKELAQKHLLGISGKAAVCRTASFWPRCSWTKKPHTPMTVRRFAPRQDLQKLQFWTKKMRRLM